MHNFLRFTGLILIISLSVGSVFYFTGMHSETYSFTTKETVMLSDGQRADVIYLTTKRLTFYRSRLLSSTLLGKELLDVLKIYPMYEEGWIPNKEVDYHA